jgi:hypothetical protein
MAQPWILGSKNVKAKKQMVAINDPIYGAEAN